jgi:acetoin utilization deacetylase AcuC-like enzyme
VQGLIGIIHHPDFGTKHDISIPHPHFESFETPERLAAVHSYFQEKNIFDQPEIDSILAKPIEEEELYRLHSPYLTDVVKSLSKLGGGEIGYHSYASKDAFDVAKLAVGGTILACEEVLKRNVDQSFALIRPPGHHSGYSNAEGLCIFNNCAVAVKYLQSKKKLNRTLIIDLDSHHGDGTTEFFYSDPTVMFISIHEYFNEADKGDIFEIGHGAGEGYNINVPLPFLAGDLSYLKSFEKVIPPLAKDFKPELIIVGMGFDTHYSDPVGNLRLTSRSYATITQQLRELAEEICEGKLVFVLEGGYNLLGLPKFIEIVIKTLLDQVSEIDFFDSYMNFTDDDVSSEAIKQVNLLRRVLSKYWKLF